MPDDADRDDVVLEYVADMLSELEALAADLVGLLAETLSQRLGGIGTGRAWQSIGIKPDAGRGYSSGRSKTIWPIWKTLRDAALETR